jgi:hypothetical protein
LQGCFFECCGQKKKVVKIRALGKVLNTNSVNISVNVKKQKQVEASGSSQWAFFTRKQ